MQYDLEESLPDRLLNPELYRELSEEDSNEFELSNSLTSSDSPTYGITQGESG